MSPHDGTHRSEDLDPPFLTPPRLPSWWLLRSLGSSEDVRSILGDLGEDFRQVADERGRIRAVLWFWWEALVLSLTLRSIRRPEQRWPNTASLWGATPRSVMTSSFDGAGLLLDGRHALRAVRNDLRLFVFSILIIGLGVGACTAVFSVLNPFLLRPLPFEEPGRLVWVANDPGQGSGMSSVTSRASNLRDFRRLNQSLDGLAGYNAFFEQQSYNLVGDGEPTRLVGVAVTVDFLDVLGVQPMLGRDFAAEEGLREGPPAVILSHGFWQRQFAGESTLVGRSVTLNGQPTEVVGVLPPSFDFATTFSPRTRVDFLRPFPVDDASDNIGNTLSMIGRLAPGASAESAQADLDRIVGLLEEADPDRWGLGATVSPLQDHISGPFRSGLVLLAASAAAVMLIVCVNLSNLLLANSSRRGKEMAVRSALGASRGRLVRQMLIESLVLSAGGALIGVAVAVAVTRFVASADGLEIPLLRTVAVDGQAFLFSIGLAILVGLLVGLLPALRTSGAGPAAAFGGSRRGMSAGRHGTRLREGLVVAEIALSCVLLVFGGLLLRSFKNVLDVELGFQTREAVSWQINSTEDFQSLEEVMVFTDALVDRVEAIPGVTAVGLTDAVPLGRNRTWPLGAPGRDYDGAPFFSTFPHLIDSRYLEAMEVPLIEGRSFSPADTESSTPVIILSETAARKAFGGEAVLGRVVRTARSDREVIGVVPDTRHRSPELDGGPQMYLPITQVWGFQTLDLVVRSSLPAEVLANDVAAAVHAVDPTIPMGEYQTLESLVDRSMSPRRFTLQLLIAFAATALLLAALGIYGVLSCAVSERLVEISIRMALGETRGGVLRRVVGKTMMLASIGLVIGAVGSFVVSRWISSMLYSVEASDPWTFLAMAALLGGVAAAAGFLPALRAARTNVASVFRAS